MKKGVLRALVISAAVVAAYFNPELLSEIITGAVIVVLTEVIGKEKEE